MWLNPVLHKYSFWRISNKQQFLLSPQCFLLNQIIISPLVHIFDIISLFSGELEEPKFGISGKGLIILPALWQKLVFYTQTNTWTDRAVPVYPRKLSFCSGYNYYAYLNSFLKFWAHFPEKKIKIGCSMHLQKVSILISLRSPHSWNFAFANTV